MKIESQIRWCGARICEYTRRAAGDVCPYYLTANQSFLTAVFFFLGLRTDCLKRAQRFKRAGCRGSGWKQQFPRRFEYADPSSFATFILFEYLLIGGTIWIESPFSRGFLEKNGGPPLNRASLFNGGTTVQFYFSKKLTWRIWPGTWPGPESRSSRSQWEVSDQNRPMRFPYSRLENRS